MKINVMGSGSWGTTLANLLAVKGYTVSVYARRDEIVEEINTHHTLEGFLPGANLHPTLRATADPFDGLETANVIVLAVPAQSMRTLLSQIAHRVPESAVLVNVAKGIEVETLLRMEQLAEQFLPHNAYATLSGPSHAEEVVRQMPTTVVAASDKQHTARFVQDLFMTNTLRVYTNSDLAGVELGGALKNVFGLGIGILTGIGAGDNTRAAMLTRGVYEISKLGMAMGARQDTFSGLTGMGDLYVTATSQHSRNNRAGILLGQGVSLEETLKRVGMVVEGVMTTKSAYRLGKKLGVELPITNEIYHFLFENKTAKECVAALMTRERRVEMEPLLHMGPFES